MNISLYRKYRPLSLDMVFGQEQIKKSISNALDNNKLAHAYLFNGPRGVGKTTIARIIAKGVNCETNGISSKPCLVCESCKSITEGYTTDVIEIDAASNRGIDEIRSLKENINYQPVRLRKKIYIIDEVHMLTNEAFNALLKTLEEPPAHIMFILATTEIFKLPETIISRCVTYDFKVLSKEDILLTLKNCAKNENFEIDDESLNQIFKKSGGSARDSLSLLEQVLSLADNNRIDISVTNKALGIVSTDYFIKFKDFIKNESKQDIILFIDNLYVEGIDILNFLKDFCDYLKFNEEDIDFAVKVISSIYSILSEFKYEDDIRILAYPIIDKILTKKDVVVQNASSSIDEDEFSYDKMLAMLKHREQNIYNKLLLNFKFHSTKDYIVYITPKNNNLLALAILEEETVKRKIEEVIFSVCHKRYILKIKKTNLFKTNDNFSKAVKSFFEMERVKK